GGWRVRAGAAQRSTSGGAGAKPGDVAPAPGIGDAHLSAARITSHHTRNRPIRAVFRDQKEDVQMKTLELRRKRAALVEQARKILDTAEAEGRSLTAEEQQQWDRI